MANIQAYKHTRRYTEKEIFSFACTKKAFKGSLTRKYVSMYLITW
jgi:hypothetical protein